MSERFSSFGWQNGTRPPLVLRPATFIDLVIRDDNDMSGCAFRHAEDRVDKIVYFLLDKKFDKQL